SRVPTSARVSPDRRASGTAYREGSAWTCSRFWCRRACFFAGKKRPRLLGVGADLAGERRQIRVAFFVAELVQEFDHDAATVDRIVEIENEHFEQRTGVDFDRRAHAKTRDAGQRRGRKAVHANGENARYRRLALQRNVGRRESEMAAELVAVNHAPR